MLLDSLLAKSKMERIGWTNRQKDYAKLRERPELLALHARLLELSIALSEQWKSYDYGEGYFYQSFDAVGITGLRDTRGRVDSMKLLERLKGKRVLEIGCNSGFLTLMIAETAKHVNGFDINPYLIDMARVVAEHLGIDNVSFETTTFETLRNEDTYDAVLSFANHSTYDKNTRFAIEEYFSKCRSLLAPDGVLLFESHPPEHEAGRLPDVLAIIENLFHVEEVEVLNYGTFLDRGRTFAVGRNRA